MVLVSEIVERARKNYPRHLTSRLLGYITSLHRIQGSTGLWDAVKFVKEVLEENGVYAKVFRVENNTALDLLETPCGWDLEYGEIEIYEDSNKILSTTTIEHPTLIAAHSPGGEGEAEIVHGSIIDGDKNIEGKAVLTKDRASLAYYLGVDKGVSAIIWYSPDRFHSAYPYTGLFLPSKLLREKIPVITLPYKIASRIIEKMKTGSKYRIRWKIQSRYHERGLPVLMACIGEADDTVAVTAHICHPLPGAHDNASGSTSIALAAITLNNIVKESSLQAKICFYWVPEYTGTVMLFKEKLVKNIVAAINYDMVASIQSLTGSTLHLIRSMIYHMGIATPVTDMVMRTVMTLGKTFHGHPGMGAIKFDETPYGFGSDHDVFLINGIEAVMVNEWPSKYYHTDMDEPYTIGWREMAIETQMLTSILYILGNINKYKSTIREYARNYYGYLTTWYVMEAIARNKDHRFIESILPRYIGRALKRTMGLLEGRNELALETGKGVVYKGVSNISSLKIALELGIDFYKTISKDNLVSQFVTIVLPALAKGKLEVEHMIDLYLAEQIATPEDIKIVYEGEKGYRALRKIVYQVIAWLEEKNLIEKQE
ncbi:M28 family peptidase [Desulfurococcaceae archaeon MEX13E-LK6-19]|nr:M28 family peptidase [Desulfurococcaceae archaeon MEX13E-LK6-19]